MVKPTLNVLKACHRLALREGEKENKEGVVKTKIRKLVLLVLLTLTVVAYNYQFYNIPSFMWLNAYKLSQTPDDYVDVTEDGQFRAWVLDYVIACDVIRTGMTIQDYEMPYDWLRDVSSSPTGFDMTIKYFDDFYFLQVRYYPDFHRTPQEQGVLWLINYATIAVWIYFALTETPLKKWRMKREESDPSICA